MKGRRKHMGVIVLALALSLFGAMVSEAAPGTVNPQDSTSGPGVVGGSSGTSSPGIAVGGGTVTTVSGDTGVTAAPSDTGTNPAAAVVSTETQPATVPASESVTGGMALIPVEGGDTAGSALVTVDPVYGPNGEIIRVGISLRDDLNGTITYGVYVNPGLYLPWQADGYQAGGTEESTHVEEIQIALTGDIARDYDVWYRGTSAIAGQHGWATNEQMMGTVGRGDYLTSLEVTILPKGSSAPGDTTGRYYSNHSEFIHISDLGSTYDGGYTGWVDHDMARYYFENGEALSGGWHYVDGYKFFFNNSGALIQNVDEIIGPQSSYRICINKAANCATVYARDGGTDYIIPVMSMLTSTGDDTPLGTFYTPEKYRWRFMINDTWTQWATRINGGVLFHSITYETTDPMTLITDGFNLLGVTQSHGCVRLLAKNAKWVYDNCKLGTEVYVYNDAAVPGPFFKPYQKWIPADQTFDPTDPSLEGAVD